MIPLCYWMNVPTKSNFHCTMGGESKITQQNHHNSCCVTWDAKKFLQQNYIFIVQLGIRKIVKEHFSFTLIQHKPNSIV